ncbi:MAG: hypothetical protein IJO43_02585 [Bacilli bacterium]|nr:hypothetical protein [Bacilli bacterium]
MSSCIILLVLGSLLVGMGNLNMKGNISSLHFYHRYRVLEKDRVPFGRKVGIGTIIIGGSVILLGILSMLTIFTGKEIFNLIGNGVIIVGLIIGLGISFYAMIKYNKGIF